MADGMTALWFLCITTQTACMTVLYMECNIKYGASYSCPLLSYYNKRNQNLCIFYLTVVKITMNSQNKILIILLFITESALHG